MNWMSGFNTVVEYIEEHLQKEIDYESMAYILGYSTYHFQRLFMMIANVSLAEYIRCRRLSKAAADLLDSECKVIDIALKYGYSSPNSFQRAFKAMHGISPGDVKKSNATIKAYPPLSFELTIKGASTMDYRIAQMDSFRIVGRKLHTTMENGESYKRVPAFWGEVNESIADILALMDAEPMGLLGVSNYNPNLYGSEFDYYISVASNKIIPKGMAEFYVPASTWAIFPFQKEGTDRIQEFQKRVLFEWLPSSGYEFAKAPDIELFHGVDESEIWVPIIKIK